MRLSNLFAGERATPPALPNFDSTTAFVRATARYLRGEEFPALGMMHPKLAPLGARLNTLPKNVRTQFLTHGGGNEGISPDELGDVDIERFREWVVDQYPEKGYPAVVVGSSNGAAVYLAAMLGVPWLPQTFLVPIRRDCHPDAIREDIQWGLEHAEPFLEANPDVSLHQMHDPNQDRLMVRKLAYFRSKSRTLGDAYEEFIETVLAEDGTVISLECKYDWPAIDLGERHSFQVGGLGGLEPEEYYEGSETVANFLASQDADIREWDVPEPDGRLPESEWGFEPALREDLERFADERGYDARRLAFDDPRDLSPFVADWYRRRYADRDRSVDRLLVQSFALVEPWWTIRTGSVPYWSAFNTEPDVAFLEDYLEGADPYDEIRATLFGHGVESAGLASTDRWREALGRATDRHGFVGVDTDEFPYDVETHVRYHRDLPREIEARHPHLPPLEFEAFDSRTGEIADDYEITWERLRDDDR
ncbi:hypothetical protein [Natronolimnohabitans innermongolicus]|uniref:Uncharacterized protein n=1 Tax=Natronolimnohabitans innermongolicus JCM 12255 TaxID=1227499 RepID=L9WVH0_9EURY|nr:hypothetical protein [Natronolimnohabitans innermongolicus]ELY53412.1 hypothetical protein C493_14118 [Natronolimnohabitans innermongolicus JCM 12255]